MSLWCLILLSGLLATGCGLSPLPSQALSTQPANRWQPILLKQGEFFLYETEDTSQHPAIISLQITQHSQLELQARWTAEQAGTIVSQKQVTAPSARLLPLSKSRLITEKEFTPFLSTILMHWWPNIDYFRWEIGFSRAIPIDMLASFMIKVVDTCRIAEIDGFYVQLKTGATLMAEACLAPNITLPLWVKHYQADGRQVRFEAKLLKYQS